METLTQEQAFKTMVIFLEEFYERTKVILTVVHNKKGSPPLVFYSQVVSPSSI